MDIESPGPEIVDIELRPVLQLKQDVRQALWYESQQYQISHAGIRKVIIEFLRKTLDDRTPKYKRNAQRRSFKSPLYIGVDLIMAGIFAPTLKALHEEIANAGDQQERIAEKQIVLITKAISKAIVEAEKLGYNTYTNNISEAIKSLLK